MNKICITVVSIITFLLLISSCKKQTYTLTFCLDDETIYRIEYVKEGDKPENIENPQKDNFQFDGWVCDGRPFSFFQAINSDMRIVATWKKTQCIVQTFLYIEKELDGQIVSFHDFQNKVVEMNQIMNAIQVDVEEGYEFSGWYYNGTLFDFSTPITDDITIYGEIKPKSFNVFFDTDSLQTVNSQRVKYNGYIIEPEEVVKEGYDFLGWYWNDKLFDFSTPITTEITLKAKWQKYEYSVTFDPQNGDPIFSQNVKYSERVEIPMEPIKVGYRFSGWYYNNELFDFSTLITTNEIALYAKWEEATYKVTFYAYGGNYIPSQELKYNEIVKKPANPMRYGYTFVGWYLNDELYDFDMPITTDIALVGKWNKQSYRIKFITNCDIIIDDQMVPYEECIEKPIVLEREGYTFLGWYEYDELFDLSMSITEPHQLVAKWDISKEKLAEVLPTMLETIIYEELYLPTILEDLNGEITWISSNSDVVDEDGKITRLPYDVHLTLTAIIKKESETYQLEFDTVIQKIELKPLVKGKIVSGYYAGYSGFTPLTEMAIQQLDVINFSFGQIKNNEAYLPNENVVLEVLKYRKSGVRVVLALGGWGADGFSEAMLTQENRTTLVNSIMRLIKKYQFDGIDIDWEYPTSSVAGITSHPNDRNNLTLFCQELREAMNIYREDLILSIAVTTSDTFYDFKNLNNYVDIFNVMTYDYAMSNIAHHDSPLYSSSNGASSMDRAVSFMKSRVDADKIIPGVAFYCRRGSFANMEQLGSSLSTSMANNAISFAVLKQIMIYDTSFVECYDSVACAAYAMYNGVFYSYDNERSTIDKCVYVKENQLGGIMCWDLTQDYVDANGTSTLLNVMYMTLKSND